MDKQTPPTPTQRPYEKMVWIGITAIVTTIITAVVGYGVGSIRNYFLANETKLTFYTENTVPFEGDNQKMAVYRTSIENNGKRMLRNVVCTININGTEIQQSKIDIASSIKFTESKMKDTYTILLPSMNPTEDVVVTLLSVSKKSLPQKPKISLRADGIIGKMEDKKNAAGEDLLLPVLSALAGMLAVFATFLTSLRWRLKGNVLKDLLDADPTFYNDDQRMTFSYLCGLYGFIDDIERYSNISKRVTYWAESDRFAALAILTENDKEKDRRKKLLKTLLEYVGVAKSSKGIVHYNIARIAKVQGNIQEMEEHLEKAKTLSGVIIDKRIKLDPVFDNIKK